MFFLLLMLLHSICHQDSNQGNKFVLLAIILLFSRRFAYLFKQASSGRCFKPHITGNLPIIQNYEHYDIQRQKCKTDHHVIGNG